MWKGLGIWIICCVSIMPFTADLAVLIEYSHAPNWVNNISCLVVGLLWAVSQSIDWSK